MLKIVCDRCGREIMYPSCHMSELSELRLSESYAFDLCKECRCEVIKFINSPVDGEHKESE